MNHVEKRINNLILYFETLGIKRKIYNIFIV